MVRVERIIGQRDAELMLCLPGIVQMAIDSWLLSRAEESGKLVFRTYAMTPPAVTIGSHQRWSRVIDEELCANFGWDWCRRPTGGGALLHKNEINYAVIVPRGLLAPIGDREFQTVFEVIGTALTRSLLEMGFNTTLNTGSRGTVASQHGLCGRSITGHEIALHDLKIVAAAQRVSTTGILQHGTIYIRAPASQDRFWPLSTGRESDMTQRWADLGERFRGGDRESIALVFATNFRSHIPAEFYPSELSPADWVGIESKVADWIGTGWNKSR